MTQNFIYAYTAIPENLNDNGMALPDWQDLPEINRVLNGAYRFYGNYARDGQYRSYLKKGNFLKAQVEDGSYQYFEIYNIKKICSQFQLQRDTSVLWQIRISLLIHSLLTEMARKS